MGLAKAFASYEAQYKAKVMTNTWGHLAPEPRKKYQGEILIAYSAYGDQIVLQDKFEGLPSSPWFYSDMVGFMSELKLESFGIYKFTGYYQRFKNGNHRFVGDIKKCSIL